MDAYRILLIDDQRDARQVFGESLRTLEHKIEVVEAPSGEEALLVLTLQHFDLLITDIRLPGISGLELKKFAQLRNPNLKMILVTGMTDGRTRQQVAEAGADAFFYKPVSISDFLSAVERCLGLGDSTSPAETLEPELPAAPQETLSDRLARLRRDTGARSALLLDGRARVMAQAGDLPSVRDPEGLLSAVVGAFSAGLRLSSALGNSTPQDVYLTRGPEASLYLAHVGVEMYLMLVSEGEETPERAAGILPEIFPAVDDLLAILKGMGVGLAGRAADAREAPETGQLEAEEQDVDVEEVAQALEEIFGQAGETSYDPVEVDEFWEAVAEESDPGSVTNADAISYEQARKLGLAPDNQS